MTQNQTDSAQTATATQQPPAPPTTPLDQPSLSQTEKPTQNAFSCPLCGITVPSHDLERHFALELARFDSTAFRHTQPDQSTTTGDRLRRGAAVAALTKISEKSKSPAQPPDEYEKVLRRVHADRIKRSVARSSVPPTRHMSNSNPTPRKRGRPSRQSLLYTVNSDSVTCFMCGMPLPPDTDAVNMHIDQCLDIIRDHSTHDSLPTSNGSSSTVYADPSSSTSSASSSTAHDPTSTSSSHEPFGEEYEWNGVTRIRATTITEGLFTSTGFSVHRKTDQDTDDEVNVDEDETDEYGAVQFSEMDLVNPVVDESNAQDGQDDVNGGSTSINSTATITTSTNDDNNDSITNDTNNDDNLTHSSTRLIIESLKSRIHDLETTSTNTPKCLVCMTPYTTPLVSITCWHVHCKECWLSALGVRRLCPQCQLITSPSELRRIYL